MDNHQFSFEHYDFDLQTGRLVLRYRLDEQEFNEIYTFPIERFSNDLDAEALERALFSLHIAAGVSYWKLYCPRNVIIKSGTLSPDQAAFWNTVYGEGLGEFHYKNNIDLRDVIEFPAGEIEAPETHGPSTIHRNPLVPVGGGKDSIVTIELLKSAGVDFTPFAIQNAGPIQATFDKLNVEPIVIDRKIDMTIVEFNKRPDTFNGHVPISMIWSFVSLVSAILYGKTDVIFSWERSASEGNLEYCGIEINHQWSKSLKFERMLQEYIHHHITRSVNVFSLIRPLSEFQIMQHFAKATQYHQTFSSCNRNFTQANVGSGASHWCGECPKCTFVFALMHGFMKHDEIVNIFGQDLFAKEALLSLYRELLGIEGNKPFECVGEAKEVVAALELCARRGDADTTLVIQLYRGEVQDTIKNIDQVIEALLTPSDDHAIPETYASIRL